MKDKKEKIYMDHNGYPYPLQGHMKNKHDPKLDSNSLKSGIRSVCRECGLEANRLTCLARYGQEPLQAAFTVSTYRKGTCDWCGKEKHITQARDFFYPDFNLMPAMPAAKKKRISLDEQEIAHLFEMAYGNLCMMTEGKEGCCAFCMAIRRKVYRFLGPSVIRTMRRRLKKYPYDDNRKKS